MIGPERRPRACLIVVLSMMLVPACEDTGETAPRINLSATEPSIDGVHLGNTPEQVQKVLGPPESTGWLDGLDGGLRTYQYYYKDRHTFALLVGFTTGVEEWGRVNIIWVREHYDGKTREGLGIGSRRDAVHRIYGHPKRVVQAESGEVPVEHFCRGSTRFRMRFNQDTLVSITLGPLWPTAYDIVCP